MTTSTVVALSRPTTTVTKSTTTATSGSVTLPISDTSNILIGMKVSGTNLSTSAIVTAISTNANITMSKAATDSGATGTVTFTKTAHDTPTNPQLCVSATSTSVDSFGVVITEDGSGSVTLTSIGRSTLANCNVTQDSNVVTLSSGNTNSLYVGQSVNGTGFTGTQARIERIISSTEFALTEKASANASNATYVLGLEHRNLAVTEGNRIKCFDDLTQTGAILPDILSTHHVFVMIHSDDSSKHHFAKVSERFEDDVAGDSFEFRPKLGDEIAKNVKFKLFSTPISNNITEVAVGLGIKSSIGHKATVSRPLFFFFNENLDKKNELDHNKKYNLIYSELDFISGATDDLATTSFFTTTPDFGTDIIDYGRHSLKTRLVDNLKNQDSPATHTSNEGETILTYTPFTRDACFTNARRDANDSITGTGDQDYTGPYRYLSYSFSKDKANLAYNVLDHQLLESMGAKGTLAEVTLADPFRILTEKIDSGEPLRIRHQLFSGDFNEFKTIGAKITANPSGNTYATTTDHDLGSYLNVGDEVRVGTRIVIVQSIASISGKTQNITFRSENRLETESIFTTGSYTLANDSVLERRAYNKKDKTLFTDFPLVVNRQNTVLVKFLSREFGFLYATVTALDVNKKLLTLSFSDKAYFDSDGSTSNEAAYHSQGTMLDYMSGQYAIVIEKLNGEVERIDNFKENGLTQIKLAGRSNIRKLISPILTKNTLFSQDIIYSTQSPYNKLTSLGGSASCNFSNNEVIAVKAVHDAALVGDKLHIKHHTGTMSYVGKVASKVASSEQASFVFSGATVTNVTVANYEIGDRIVHVPVTTGSSVIPDDTFVIGINVSSNQITLSKDVTSNITSIEKLERPVIILEDFSRAETRVLPSGTLTSGGSDSATLFKESNKNYVLNKALATNPFIDSTTSLSGASNKGLFFNSGVKITPTGAEGDRLVGTSGSDNENAIGYEISDVSNMLSDAHFQAILEDEGDNAESFDTINTLIDFEIVSKKSAGQNKGTVVKIAPYNPLTLGRVDINYASTQDTSFSKKDLGKTLHDFSYARSFIDVNSDEALSAVNHLRGQRNLHGKPIYINGKFLANVVSVEKSAELIYSSTWSTGGNTVEVTASASHGLSEGMVLSGNGAFSGNTITSIDGNTLTITGTAGAGTTADVEFSLPSTLARIYLDREVGKTELSCKLNSNLTVTDIPTIEDIFVGMGVTGTGIPASTTVTSVGVKSITISNAATISLESSLTFTLLSGTVVDKLHGHNNDDITRESSKLTHELNFLNGGHLHGAKNISLIHPKVNNANAFNITSVLNYRMNGEQVFHRRQNTSGGNAGNTARTVLGSVIRNNFLGSYQSSFGASNYRLNNIEQGNYNKTKHLFFRDKDFHFYVDKPSKIGFYGSGYRYNAGYYTDGFLKNNIIGTDICGLNFINHGRMQTFSGSPYVKFLFEIYISGGANSFSFDVFRLGQSITHLDSTPAIPENTFVGNIVGKHNTSTSQDGEFIMRDKDGNAVNATANSTASSEFHAFDNKKIIESRGYIPCVGDKFYETKTLEKFSNSHFIGHDQVELGGSPRVLYNPFPFVKTFGNDTMLGTGNKLISLHQFKDQIEQIDPKIARMFLFSNSDLLPYSSTRKDSLLNKKLDRSLSEYSMLTINSPRKNDFSETKEAVLGKTNSLEFLDDSYNTFNIRSVISNKKIGELRRFSLMRLTEVTFDIFYNQFDPENIPKQDKNIGIINRYPQLSIINTGASASSISGKVINTVDPHTGSATTVSSLVAGDIVCDKNGRYIGVVDSISTGVINLKANAHKTDLDANSAADFYVPRYNHRDGSSPNGQFMRLFHFDVARNQLADASNTVGAANIKGYNGDNDFSTVGLINPLQMATMRGLASAINGYVDTVRTDKESGYGGLGTKFALDRHPENTGSNPATAQTSVQGVGEDSTLILPITFAGDSIFSQLAGNHTIAEMVTRNYSNYYSKRRSEIFAPLTELTFSPEDGLGSVGFDAVNAHSFGGSTTANITNHESKAYMNHLPVFLDRYKIAGGTGAKVSIGMTAPRLVSCRQIDFDATSANKKEVRFGIQSKTINASYVPAHAGFRSRKVKTNSTDITAGVTNADADFVTYNNDADGVFAGLKPLLKIDTGYIAPCTFTLGSARCVDDLDRVESSSLGQFGSTTLNYSYLHSPEGKIPKFTRVYEVDMVSNPNKLFMTSNATSAGTDINVRVSQHYVTKEEATNGTEVHVISIHDKSVLRGETSRASAPNLLFPNNLHWLSYMDLTGCYLVSEEVEAYNPQAEIVEDYATAGGGIGGSHGIGSGQNMMRYSINNTSPKYMLYVISHEIDTTRQERNHILTLSGTFPDAVTNNSNNQRFKNFRIMQPNHTCFHSFSPNKIRINELSSKYTKMPSEDATYPAKIPNYLWGEEFSDRTQEGNNEAVLSMYVVVDPDGQSADGNLVVENPVNLRDNIMASGTVEMNISDGSNSKLTSVTFEDSGDNIRFDITIEKQEEMLGVVSLSETIDILVDGQARDIGERALIGSVVSVCQDSDKLINELMEINDLDFNLEESAYPYYVAPNFRGVDLFSAIKFLMSKKNKKLIEDNGVFTIDENDSSIFKTSIFFTTKNTDTRIFTYSKEKSEFDLFNEIIVNGKNKKSVVRDIRSIMLKGRKTLQVFENELVTQSDVNKRARELLKLHNNNSFGLSISVGHKGISHLRVGDVVTVEIPEENIARSRFIVLEIKHNLTGTLDLELGSYTKGLEDRFTELAIENRGVNNKVREDDIDDSDVAFNFLDLVKVKPIEFKVVKKSTPVGAFTLGTNSTDSETLNTNTNALNIGVTTFTTLLEEEF